MNFQVANQVTLGEQLKNASLRSIFDLVQTDESPAAFCKLQVATMLRYTSCNRSRGAPVVEALQTIETYVHFIKDHVNESTTLLSTKWHCKLQFVQIPVCGKSRIRTEKRGPFDRVCSYQAGKGAAGCLLRYADWRYSIPHAMNGCLGSGNHCAPPCAFPTPGLAER